MKERIKYIYFWEYFVYLKNKIYFRNPCLRLLFIIQKIKSAWTGRWRNTKWGLSERKVERPLRKSIMTTESGFLSRWHQGLCKMWTAIKMLRELLSLIRLIITGMYSNKTERVEKLQLTPKLQVLQALILNNPSYCKWQTNITNINMCWNRLNFPEEGLLFVTLNAIFGYTFLHLCPY